MTAFKNLIDILNYTTTVVYYNYDFIVKNNASA